MATEAEIQNANRAIDQWFLGKTSKHHESGNAGPAAISTGRGDHGGISYGSYQLASRTGTLALYLRETNNYDGAFDGLTPRTPAFDAKWRELATNDPKFHESQHDFIASRHYEPLSNRLEAAGYDFSNRGRAVQDMIWSTAVQYGGGDSTVNKFRRAERESGLDFSTATDKEIVAAVQDSKYRHYQEDFRSSQGNWRGISNRILEEKDSLVRLAEREQLVDRPLRGVNQESITPNNDVQGNQPRPFSNPDDYGSLQVPASFAALHNQVDGHIKQLYAEKGVHWGDGGDNTVAACTVECVKQKVTDVQVASVGNGNIHLGQKMGCEWNVASLDAVQAARTPQQESFAQLVAFDQQLSQQQDNPTQTQTKTRSGPTMG